MSAERGESFARMDVAGTDKRKPGAQNDGLHQGIKRRLAEAYRRVLRTLLASDITAELQWQSGELGGNRFGSIKCATHNAIF